MVKQIKYLPKYDVSIIGGGIAGLYCAYELSKKYNVILYDDRNYIGGRIYTDSNGLELGAARFNNSHKILLGLINKFNLKKYELPLTIDYVNNDGNLTNNAHKEFDKLLTDVLNKTKISDKLRNITFYKHICNVTSKKNADHIVNLFGYHSEIVKMNAYDAYNTFKNDFGNIQYYVLVGGLSQLCKCLMNEIIKNGSKVKLNTKVESVKDINSKFLLSSKKLLCESKKIIFAVKPHQLKNFSILKPIHKHIKSVYPSPLLRIYASYPNKIWFDDVNRTTTNNVLRQIIPINKEKGLIMVSYTDGPDTYPFREKNGKLKSKKELKQIIKYNLQKIFPNKQIQNPTFFKAYLWNVGCHHWKPKYNSLKINNEIYNPLKNIFIVGEGFSFKQAWIEGALIEAKRVVKLI